MALDVFERPDDLLVESILDDDGQNSIEPAVAAASRFQIRATELKILTAIVLVLVGCFVAFLIIDDTPPNWDGGVHLMIASDLRDALRSGSLLAPVTLYNHYPPLVHTITAIFLLVLGSSWTVALLQGLVWQLVLAGAANRLGSSSWAACPGSVGMRE